MVTRLLQAGLLATGVLLAALAGAADTADASAKADKAAEERIRAKLEVPSMGLAISGVDASEVPGLYLVQFSNGPVVYATASGEHFILGDLHEVTDKGFVNLTEKRRGAKRLEQLAQVKPADMIIFSPEGEPRTHITVFTDVTCFYCQKLHKEVPELNKRGIEVRYLAYPRAGPGSDGYRKLETAWCAKDRQDVLTRLKAKEAVPENICPDNPVAAQFELGQAVGVNGTPALFTADGELISGYRSADDLEKILGLE